jgi:hypothetical protein
MISNLAVLLNDLNEVEALKHKLKETMTVFKLFLMHKE